MLTVENNLKCKQKMPKFTPKYTNLLMLFSEINPNFKIAIFDWLFS